MPKGYWIVSGEVFDPEGYKAYVAANAAPLAAFGARFLVRAGRSETVEGVARPRAVVIEFPDYETALACWRSPAYAAARALREGKAEVSIVVIEGYDGPQPGG